MSRWYRTIQIPLLIASYAMYKGRYWLNSNPNATWRIPQSPINSHPPLTIVRTVLKESGAVDVLEVTSDSKVTFENHLSSVSSAASQRLSIFMKCLRLSILLMECALRDAFGVLSYPFRTDYCSAVWCLGAHTVQAVEHIGPCILWSVVPFF